MPVVVDDPMLCCARVIGGDDDNEQDFENDPEFSRERDEMLRKRQELLAIGAKFGPE